MSSLCDRLVDNTVVNDYDLGPIYGYQSEIIVSLEKAIEPIQLLIHNLVNYVKKVNERCYYVWLSHPYQ